MSFTGEIKRELMKKLPEKRCCRCALIAAAVDASGTRDGKGFSFTSENERLAGVLIGLVEQVYGVSMTLSGASYDPKQGKDKLTFSCIGEPGEAIAAELDGCRSAEDLPDCCANAYLKGAFLASGSCTLPRAGTKTGYHLEVVFDDARLAENYCDLLGRFQLIAGIVRRGSYVVYLKSREAIADFLSVLGADGALGTLETVSSVREERGNENRIENCMAGNADKSATASVSQVLAIERLRRSGKLDTLSPSLVATANARLAHPDLSLGELAELLSVGKSCLNHRMRKLMQLCADAENKGEPAGRTRQE